MPRSSSSSSDEEEDLRLQQLREVTVTFDSLKKLEKEDKKETPKKSKRCQEVDEDPNNFCEVTPEFQEFVAKKLKQKLDESIEIISEPIPAIKKKKSNDSDKFQIIKNLYWSNYNENNTEENIIMKKSKKKKKKSKKTSDSDSDSDTDLNMLKEAAIDVNFLAKTTCIERHKQEFLSNKK